MKMRHLVLVMLCWVTVAATMSGQAGSAREALEAARKTAVIDGNLADAIKQYEAIAAKYQKTDRVAAAQALLRIAECYEKQGNAEAQRAYQRVIKEYADQATAVAEATSKVVAINSSARREPVGKRQLWTLKPGDWITGHLSPDGGLAAYATEGTAGYELAIHDLLTGADRSVAQGKQGESDFIVLDSAFSRDGSKIAYRANFSSGSRDVVQLRVVDLSGQPLVGPPQPRVLLESTRPNANRGRGVWGDTAGIPFDWTPDGKWVVVLRNKDAGTWEYGLVSTAGESPRVLKTVQFGRRPGGGYLSPDGTFLAVEVPEDASGAANIVILPVDGGAEIGVVGFKGHDNLMGWAPDGRSVLFTSDRTGSNALWRQEIAGRRLQGQAEILIRDLGPLSWSLLVTPDGTLYARTLDRDESAVMEASFDFATGVFASAPTDVADRFVRSSHSPRWSPDGKQLAYVSLRPVAGEFQTRVPVVRTLDSGESHDVPLSFNYQYWAWDWMPDSSSIAMVGHPTDTDPNSARGVYQVNARSGVASPIVLTNATGRPSRSTDGRTLFYTRPTARPVAPGQEPWLIVARDILSGTERETPSSRMVENWEPARLSSDGTKAYVPRSASSGTAIIERDLTTATERVMLRLSGESTWTVTTDGRALVATTVDLKTNEGVLVLCSLADGSVRTLFRGARSRQLGVSAWAPDKASVIVRSPSPDQEGPDTFWWVPLDGRQPKPLKELTGLIGQIEVHPGGRRLAFEIRHRIRAGEQLWMIENVLSAVGGRGR